MRAVPPLALLAAAALLAAPVGCRKKEEPKGIGGPVRITRGAPPEAVDTTEKLAAYLREYEGVMEVKVLEEPTHKQVEVLMGYKDPQDYSIPGPPRIPAGFRFRVETEMVSILHKIFTAKVKDPPAAAWVKAISGWEDRTRKIRLPIKLIEVSATREQAEKIDWETMAPTVILFRFQVMDYNRSVLVALKPPIYLQ